jgi:hypothetical protein
MQRPLLLLLVLLFLAGTLAVAQTTNPCPVTLSRQTKNWTTNSSKGTGYSTQTR